MLVYDASTFVFPWWLGLAVIGMSLIAATVLSQMLSPTGPRVRQFTTIFAIAALSLGFLTLSNPVFQRWRCSEWAKSGRYQVIEGRVTQFHPMPPGGHDTEHFVVGSTRFDYSDADLSKGGFAQPVTRGGPMRSGLHVRVAHRDGRILKLWVLSD